MRSMNITVLDFGMCNLLNMVRAFEYIGCSVEVTESPTVAQNAERLVVPGVGAFRHCIEELKTRELDQGILKFIDTGRPFLGVCVGMQMLFDQSEEFGESPGLGILKGTVQRVPDRDMQGHIQGVPHIGWNTLTKPLTGRGWESSLLNDFNNSPPAMYFVHSYAAVPKEESIRLADCVYGGHRLCAAVEIDNIMATQFHPERSGSLGLEVLRRFANY